MPARRLDVIALLDRLDMVAGLPAGVPARQGQWLVDRWWRLRVAVIPDHRLVQGEWQPGVWIDACDPSGRFGTDGFVAFDECRLTREELRRIHAFIGQWLRRRQEVRERKRVRAMDKGRPSSN